MATSQKNAKNTSAQNATEDNKDTAQTPDATEKTDNSPNTVQASSAKKKKESEYTVEEFVANAEALFHVKPECAQAAFREEDTKKCTKAEAERIVEKFKKKEVK